MKILPVLLLLLGFTAPAFADEPYSICELPSTLAEKIMGARQAGVAMSKQMEILATLYKSTPWTTHYTN